MSQDIIRVFRILEYSGPRDIVEKTITNSIQGEKRIPMTGLVIKAATLGVYPDILQEPSTPGQKQ